MCCPCLNPFVFSFFPKMLSDIDKPQPQQQAQQEPQQQHQPQEPQQKLQDDFVTSIRNANENPSAENWFKVGLHHLRGTGGAPINNQAAFEWISSAAKRSLVEAQICLAELYLNGHAAVAGLRNSKLAGDWFRKAASNNSPIAMYNLGCMNSQGLINASSSKKKRNDAAVKWWKKSAEGGYGDALYCLYQAYHLGKYDLPSDPHQAFKWLKLGAEKGHLNSLYTLGILYDEGQEGLVAKDCALAFQNFLLAAERGHAGAQFQIAIMLDQGEESAGIVQDQEEAKRWYRMSARGGNPDAMFAIGVMYDEAQGFARNLPNAIKWFGLAANAEHVTAAVCLAAAKAELQAELEGDSTTTTTQTLQSSGVNPYDSTSDDVLTVENQHDQQSEMQEKLEEKVEAKENQGVHVSDSTSPANVIDQQMQYEKQHLQQQEPQEKKQFPNFLQMTDQEDTSKHSSMAQTTTSSAAAISTSQPLSDLVFGQTNRVAAHNRQEDTVSAAISHQVTRDHQVADAAPVAVAVDASVSPVTDAAIPQCHEVTIASSQEAFKFFLQTARQGDASAQAYVGQCYFNGSGGVVGGKNIQHAIHWWREAARQGNERAQFNLGVVFSDAAGVGGSCEGIVPVDLSESRFWFVESARQGNRTAIDNIARIDFHIQQQQMCQYQMYQEQLHQQQQQQQDR